MMRRLWILIAALALLAGGMLLMARSRGPTWTVDSDEALIEFEEGLDARQRIYPVEAREHFARAVELAPDFAVARLLLAESTRDKEEREPIVEELRRTDLESLSGPERYMVRIFLANHDGDVDEARRLIGEFAESHPNHPFALLWAGHEAWERQDLDRAETYFRRLIEAHPNWVLAQNLLGYIAMARGDFAESEDLFETYKFIAPDHPNPHDSLGELLTLLGRYEEARRELEQALEIKPDFCASYAHLIDVAVMEAAAGEAEEILDRIEEHCPPEFERQQRCRVALWRDFYARDFEAVWQAGQEDCDHQRGDTSILLHHAAVLTGRTEAALEREAALAEHLERAEQRQGYAVQFGRGALLHMEGFRLLAEGRAEEAARRFELADRSLLFWGDGQGLFKLYNRLNLAIAQRRLGEATAADETLAGIAAINDRAPKTYAIHESCLQSGTAP